MGVNDTGLGPPGFIGGRGGMVGGEDLDWIFTSTGDPGIAGTLLSAPTVENKRKEISIDHYYEAGSCIMALIVTNENKGNSVTVGKPFFFSCLQT